MFLWVKIEHAPKKTALLFSQVISSIYFWLYPEGQTPDVQLQVQWEQCGHGFSSETEEMGMAVGDDGSRPMGNYHAGGMKQLILEDLQCGAP